MILKHLSFTQGTWQFMSVAILRDPKRRQDHIDDRESAFHVLVYNLLRYTKHNRLKGLQGELRIFDECDEGNTGGKLKAFFLLQDVKGLVFTKRPVLDQLIQELAVTFSVRYEGPPDAALDAFFKSEAGAESSLNPAIRRRNLNERWWLVETMRKYLQDKSEWINKDDRACLNSLISAAETARRKTKQQNDIANRDGAASRKRSHKAMYGSSESDDYYDSDESEEDEEDGDDDDLEEVEEEDGDEEEEEDDEGVEDDDDGSEGDDDEEAE